MPLLQKGEVKGKAQIPLLKVPFPTPHFPVAVYINLERNTIADTYANQNWDLTLFSLGWARIFVSHYSVSTFCFSQISTVEKGLTFHFGHKF